ncbi:hypothetical protein FGRMN_10695 [Fusarium graminum]|nr:hypothetical protein FGRMN_10695 [Fusarium graminum]
MKEDDQWARAAELDEIAVQMCRHFHFFCDDHVCSAGLRSEPTAFKDLAPTVPRWPYAAVVVAAGVLRISLKRGSDMVDRQGISQATVALSIAWPCPRCLGNALAGWDSFGLDDFQYAAAG